MTLDDLNELRYISLFEDDIKERLYIKLCNSIERSRVFAELNNQFASSQNIEDITIIICQLKDWFDKSKNEAQKKIFLELFLLMIDVSGYISIDLEHKPKILTSMYYNAALDNKDLRSNNRELEFKLSQIENELKVSNQKLKDIQDKQIDNF